jgi:ABC-type nitrate/sulfonate/bicarbonate transport system substrate-binding protein
MKRFPHILSLTLAVAAACAASQASAQEVVRLGNLKFAHYGAVSYIKEIAPKCGIKVEEHVFAKGPDVMQAILAGELDVGATASEAAIPAAPTARLSTWWPASPRAARAWWRVPTATSNRSRI